MTLSGVERNRPCEGQQYDVEARILHDEEPMISHTFAPWHIAPFATPRAAAIAWAEAERKAIEGGR